MTVAGMSSNIRLKTQLILFQLVLMKFRNVINKPVVFESHSIIGAGCIILPGVIIGEGSAIGALSLITKDLSPWGVYFGTPAKFIKDRKKSMLDFLDNCKLF